MLQQIARYNVEKTIFSNWLQTKHPILFIHLEHFLSRFSNGAGKFYQCLVTKNPDPLLTTLKMPTFEEFQELMMNIDVKIISNPVIINEYELYQFIVLFVVAIFRIPFCGISEKHDRMY